MKLLGKACALFAAAGLCATAMSAPDAESDASRAGLIEQARQLHTDAQRELRTVLHLRELAHKQKDVIKLNCVNEMLVQIKPHLNLLEDGQANLPTTNEPAATFGAVQASANSIRELAERAAQCVGEPDLGSESSNSFTHPDVPDDPFQGPEPWGDSTVEAPGYASPFS